MNKINCEVIRDLLPLYVDDAASQQTRELIQEHLNNCPDCREDLRLMRSQVSLPIDEDTQQVLDKIRERREKLQKKRKITTVCMVSAIALLIVLILCYIWPRSWARFARLDQIDTVFVTAHELYFKYPDEEEEPPLTDWHYWKLNVEGDSIPAQQLLNALDNIVFLPKISNLRNYTPFPREHYSIIGAGSSVDLTLFTQDYQDSFNIIFYNNGLVIVRGSNGGVFVYGTRKNPYESLAAIVREYGTLQEN